MPITLERLPVKDPFIVRRKLKWWPVPGISPEWFRIREDNPAIDVPRAVFTIAVAIATPSPGFEILP